MEKKKPNKERAEKYEEKLAIKGTLDDILKIALPKKKRKGKAK